MTIIFIYNASLIMAYMHHGCISHCEQNGSQMSECEDSIEINMHRFHNQS